jgi:nitric oxide reductase NorQ protein
MELAVEKYKVKDEPYYLPVGQEIELFEAAYQAKLPVMLKGPTGCGKTRFVEHMAWKLGRPLITVACHEDLSSTDLVGRFLLEGEDTIWHDGPLTAAVRAGAICYLDEVVATRIYAGRLLQSGVSINPERPQTINPPAFYCDGI